MALIGHVLRNPATGEVAIRTAFTEEIADMVWLVAHPRTGGRYVGAAAVDGWDDLYIPPVETVEGESS